MRGHAPFIAAAGTSPRHPTRQIMFSFFKRFKGGKTPDTPSQDSEVTETPSPAASEPAPAPAPSPIPAPTTAPAPTAQSPVSAQVQPSVPAPAAMVEQIAESEQADEIETQVVVPPPAPEPAQKQSWLARLRSGLSKTSAGLTGIFVRTKIDDELYEELETALLMSDAGVEATEFLLGALREKVRTQRLTDPQQVKAALRTLLVDLLKPLEKSLML